MRKEFIADVSHELKTPITSIMGYADTLLEEEYDKEIIPTIIPNWDHSPRSLGKALVLNHAEPRYFEKHVKNVMIHIENKPFECRLAFVKSWNEWAEGNYLEPDLRYGKRYLEVMKECILKE